MAIKAALLFVIAITGMAFFIVAIDVASENNNQQKQAVKQAKALITTSALVMQSAADDKQKTKATLSSLTVNTAIAQAQMIHPSDAGLSAPVMNVMNTGHAQFRSNNTTLFAAAPVYTGPQTRPSVFLARVDLTRLRAPLYHIIMRKIWVGLALIGVGMPASLLVFNRLFAPIPALTALAERAARGDLDARIENNRTDELGVLAHTFNTMLERMKANLDRTRWLAYGDNLTRLANKTAFMERLKQLVSPKRPPGALLLIDVDGFKHFNDAYGQEEGDRILTMTAQRLGATLKAKSGDFAAIAGGLTPFLARLSGDEFAVIIPGARAVPELQTLSAELLAAIATPFDIAGQAARLSARIGVALYPHDASDAQHLLTSVNLAIDAAKADGGGAVRFFEPAMSQKALKRMSLHSELRRAIKDKEFVVYYQPKIRVRDGSIAGAEALVRWRQPGGKIVGPGAFIEAAEDTGMILDIGDFVLRESCEAAVRWQNAGHDCGVAVNVSALQFACDDFSTSVLQIIEQTGIAPEKLELELTESVAMADPDRMMDQVGPLRDRRVRFAIDDFGTGHSSLAYLTRLPFDVFKIDQSFVQAMNEDKHARVIVQTVLAMAESLGYHTVAEGVETREHFAFLQLHCCDYVQGYYFAKPMPESEFLAMLAAERQNLTRKPVSRAPVGHPPPPPPHRH